MGPEGVESRAWDPVGPRASNPGATPGGGPRDYPWNSLGLPRDYPRSTPGLPRNLCHLPFGSEIPFIRTGAARRGCCGAWATGQRSHFLNLFFFPKHEARSLGPRSRGLGPSTPSPQQLFFMPVASTFLATKHEARGPRSRAVQASSSSEFIMFMSGRGCVPRVTHIAHPTAQD